MTAYVRAGNRLAVYAQRATSGFWEQSWGGLSEPGLEHALRATGRLGVDGLFFRRHLPRKGVVLEAGCGVGIVVKRLSHRGYSCVGVDFSIPSLVRSKRVSPDLRLAGGDVLNLPFRPASLAAYVSLGVVEHFEDGPHEALLEAARVLQQGGALCLSVPYLNGIRQRLLTLTKEEAVARNLEFYQYCFSEADLSNELRRAGLRPVGSVAYRNSYRLLRGRLPILRRLGQFLPRESLWTPMFDFVPGLPKLAAHMMLTAAIKP